MEFEQAIENRIKAFKLTYLQSEDVEKIIDIVINCLRSNGTLFFAGNGGSAAEAQHIAAEYVGRFKLERLSLPAISLTVDTSAITAIANDYGFEKVFSRQLEGLAKPGDVLFVSSTSGNSANLLDLAEIASCKNVETVAFLGNGGGKLKSVVDQSIIVNSLETAIIQEIHLFLGHFIVDCVERELFPYG
jgi:D-sedoheptulose 7-phosphate isomerase